MKIVQSASLHTIEDASHVFERQPSGGYLCTKSDVYRGVLVGISYIREYVHSFALKHKGTLIIEGGNDMKSESNVNQRTITLVTIPQEAADAIAGFRRCGHDNAWIIECITFNAGSTRSETLKAFVKSDGMETLLSALVNGYTVEKSAEELAHDAIRAIVNSPNEGDYDRGIDAGIRFALNKLEISVEGVNA